MSARTSAFVRFGLLCFVLSSCQEKDEAERPSSITIGGGPTAPTGTPQGQGGDDGDPSATGTARGVVVQFLNDSFDGATAFPGVAAISIASPSGSSSVETNYDGVDFAAEGEVLGERWVFVEPDDSSAFPTITLQEFGSEEASVPVVPRAVLEQIFQNLTTPAELNSARAQLLFRVVDSSGNSVSGVEADSFVIGEQSVAYKEGAIWAGYLEATTEEGLALVPNLPASAFPGQILTAVLTGAIDEEVDVRLVRGAITVVTVVVP